MKKISSELNVILTIILITCIIFMNKSINIAHDLSISVAMLIYPFTFLIPVLIYKKYKSSETKKAIISSALYILFFYTMIFILINITSNADTLAFDEHLIAVFAPNIMEIGNFTLFYPQLFILGFLITYVLTRFILIAVYDAVTSYTNTYLGFALALFIAFIIDTILLVSLYYFNDIFYGNLDAIGFIQHLTANFIAMIFVSILLTFFYPLIVKYYN